MEKQERIDELKQLMERNRQMGGPERITAQHALGRLTARERIVKLFDPGTFKETWLLLQALTPDREGTITHINKVSGSGKIDGRTVIVNADDATARTAGYRPANQPPRGTYSRLYPEMNHPVIHLADGGDARTFLNSADRLPDPIPTRAFTGLRRVPHVTAVMGDVYGAAALEVTTADFVVQVKGTSFAISDPRLLDRPLAPETSLEELGGWKVHSEVTGQVDAIAENEEQALQIIREFLSYLPENCDKETPLIPNSDPRDRILDKLMTIIPDKANRVYDMHQVIKQIVDDGRFFPVKGNFGKTLITCLARMNGRPVGFIANQTLINAGAAGPDECDKAADFIILCDTFNIPLVFLADTPGFLVGRPAEQKRIPTKIIAWMQAIAFSTVPKMCIIIRKAYGMGISNMCGTNCGPDYIAALTTAEISFMSPEAAANVVYLRRIESAPDPKAERAQLIRQMERESSPFPAAHAGLLDDVLDPRDTRKYIIDCLETLRSHKGDFIGEHRLQGWPTGF
ncbi:MAG: carboxyl transferase domain-containing protein [Dehalococcoidia bacterium]|nr:carboxyl transferase domain-containing protein [Dehalococcoidia bacterium]